MKYVKLSRKMQQKQKLPLIERYLADNGFNKPLVAGLAGMAAISFNIIFTYVLKQLNLIIWDFSQIGAAVATNGEITSGLGAYVVGTFQNLILGGLFGVTFYYSLIFLGRDQIYFKSIGFAAVVWMVTRSLYLYLFKIPTQLYSKTQYVIIYYSGLLIWGLILAFLLNKLIFQRKTVTSENNKTMKVFFVPLPARKKDNRKTKFKKPIKPRRI